MKPLWLVSLLAAAAAAPLAAQTIVRAGTMEKLPLVSATEPKTWSAAESTATPSSDRVKVGASSWRWHIDVDHQAGEPQYPIGWPRISHAIPPGARRDWSDWDFLHLWVFVETSREALPAEPAGLGLHTPDRASGYNRPLRELRKGEWTELNLPIAQIPRHGDVRQIQFHIAEANYRHGDRVDFFINDLALTRHAEPVIVDFAAENAVVFSDAPHLPVRFQLLGVKPCERMTIACELRRDGRTAARMSAAATRGAQRVVLALGGQPLAPGAYELRAGLPGAATPVTAALRVVESPWK